MALADDEIAAWAAKQGFVSKDGTDPGAAEAAERLIGLAGELGDMKAFESPFYQGSPEVRVVLTRVEAKGTLTFVDYARRHGYWGGKHDPHVLAALSTTASFQAMTFEVDARGRATYFSGRAPDGVRIDDILAALGVQARLRFMGEHLFVVARAPLVPSLAHALADHLHAIDLALPRRPHRI